ncbi:MAG: IS3 family transposase [[Clostridium] spiroforme]|nr:IS3 family transposase [Thomasclavelia spiroformis]
MVPYDDYFFYLTSTVFILISFVSYRSGSEFKNEDIEKVLKTFNINRSLSAKGSPYDNAVAEAIYKIIKAEFSFNKRFEILEELELELFDYVNWYNNVRIHGSLDHKTPVEFRIFS